MQNLKIKEVLNQNMNLMAIIKTNRTGTFNLLIRTINTIELYSFILKDAFLLIYYK